MEYSRERSIKVTLLKHRDPIGMAMFDTNNLKPMDYSFYNLEMTKKELRVRMLMGDVTGLIILLGEKRLFNQAIRDFLLNTMAKLLRNVEIIVDERDEYLL